MNVLIFNCGSSSQTFKVYQASDNTSFSVLASGKAQPVATTTQALPRIDWTINAEIGIEEAILSSHRRAAEQILRVLREHAVSVDAIGHRFVHVGEWFHQTTRITPAAAENFVRCFPLAPIHNPNSYSVFEACKEQLPQVPQFAVFDTAFHHDMPPEAVRYALPLALAHEHGLHKFGFHGLSCSYVSERAAQLLGKSIHAIKLVLCHLGTGGSSVTAFKDGHSVDTSMGYSPLPGLIMSTRCGDIDAEIVLQLLRKGLTYERVSDILNNESGLLGMSGFSSNLEEVMSEGDRGNGDCRIAADAYVNRLKTYLGGYYWALNGADAIVFTDSLGTRSWKLRERVCGDEGNLGIHLDNAKNRSAPPDAESFVESRDSATRIIVIPTDEELVILREVLGVL
jgi:acetate kinase